MMKKRALSLALALVMTMALLPASVLSAAAEGAYQVLFEPQLSDPLYFNYDSTNDPDYVSIYGDTATVWSVADRVYRLIRFTGNGVEQIPGKYAACPKVGANFIITIVPNGKNDWLMGVIDKQGHTVIEPTFYTRINRPDDSGITTALGDGGPYRINLNSGEVTTITLKEYNSFNGYLYERDFSADQLVTQISDIDGDLVFSDENRSYRVWDPWLVSIMDGFVSVQDRDTYKHGLVNLSGEMVVPMQYGDVLRVKNGYITADRDTLIDLNGNVIISAGEYKFLSDVSPDGLIWAEKSSGSDPVILKVDVGAPTQPVQPIGTSADPTNDKLTRDGEEQDPTVYKIGDSNYFKIRDLAAILNNTDKQFSVGYDNEKQSVTATTGEAYTMTGTELKGAASASQTAEVSNDAIYVNGEKVEAHVYKIAGSNYFKLRDLGKALDFYVGWTQEKGMFIETDKPYSE